jgi:hypothetical protein
MTHPLLVSGVNDKSPTGHRCQWHIPHWSVVSMTNPPLVSGVNDKSPTGQQCQWHRKFNYANFVKKNQWCQLYRWPLVSIINEPSSLFVSGVNDTAHHCQLFQWHSQPQVSGIYDTAYHWCSIGRCWSDFKKSFGSRYDFKKFSDPALNLYFASFQCWFNYI